MKREHDAAELTHDLTLAGVSSSPPGCKRRRVNGNEHGLPDHASVVEEIEEVHEYQTILLRFPCFDFFRNVHLCEMAGDDLGKPASSSTALAAPETRTRGEAKFAPEALQFLTHTLDTDTPIAVLNRGAASEMVFEGQWCEVSGDGTAVTNRAVVHLASEAAGPLTQTSEVPSAVAASSSSASSARETSSAVASLLPHAVAGVTADEERRARTEQLQGWVYDRVDVPSAVLVMQRVR
ncbi:hypothetical protein ABB37_04317 [Leptomonas pyrrhocoris]|uniref:Uncharacterized protein n=1 Tax=Leptomonas pyrrhocoris TaxID=157538 RepID=A0A0M9G2J9_LEPPY|nr:hypothetical protein ABB37_04317 [Leptomonas pyrrhocoris]KPA80917.1 hypothetical protein ABB37_04317 [Leptomonas pyrrhocoris]|eukprot:XP_015659356.1 hypothetical protein ABB37_04317 [Leptomonas pyrrhocoris]